MRNRLFVRTLGFGWAGLVVVCLISLSTWVILGAPPASRVPWLRWFLVMCGLAVAGLTLAAAARRVVRSPGLALRRLRERHPDLGEALEGALGFGRQPFDASPTGWAFAQCHRRRVEERLGALPPSELVSFASLGRLLSAGALVGAAFALLLASVPDAPRRLASQLGFVGGPDRLPLVLAGPVARPLRIEVHPPRYTGQAPRAEVPGKAATDVPEGSRVTLLFEADRVVTEVIAALPDGSRRIGESLGDRILRVRFVARREGRVVMAVRDTAGVLHVGAGGPAIRLQPDRPPGLDVQPRDAVIRQEKAQPIDLGWKAEDDFGITAVRLVFAVDDGPKRQEELFRGVRFGQERRTKAQGTHRLDLAALRLGPGSRVRFHLVAEDNRSLEGADGGPGRTASPEQEVRIEGSRSVRLDVLAGVRPLLDSALMALGDRYERFVGKIPPERCPEAIGELGRLRGQELALATSFGAFVQRVRAMTGELPPLLGEVFEGPLSALVHRLDRVTRADRAAAVTRPGLDCFGSARATGVRVTEALEELVLELDALTGRATLEEMKDVVRRAEALRQEIHKRVEEQRKSPSDRAREKIAALTDELRQTLARLSRLAGSLGDEVMEEHVNRYALREEKRERVLNQLGRQGGRGGSDPLASLDRMVKQLEEAVGQGIDRFRQVMPIAGEEARSRRADALRSLSDRLSSLQEEVGRSQDPKGLSNRQKALAQETRSLSGQGEGQGPGPKQGKGRGGKPGAENREGSGSAPSLRETARRMEEAAAALGRGEKQAAKRLGDEALGMLRHLQAEAERASRLTAPSDGGELADRGDVKVPAAGAALPRELRKSIQEAGRAAWPEAFREALRSYYERLLR